MSDEASTPPERPRNRLISISLDEASIGRTNPNIEHEREVAIFDILDGNQFSLDGRDGGPYTLTLSMADDRLAFNVADEHDTPVITHLFSLTPLKKIMKDYFMVCENYYEAIRTAPAARIQAIDMGRRGLHDEGSVILSDRLKGKIAIDFDTARRLFTLICALHWKG